MGAATAAGWHGSGHGMPDVLGIVIEARTIFL